MEAIVSPEIANMQDVPPIPVRMLNEYVYCPRLAYLMWVQGEFAESADTVEGKIGHRRVDRPGVPLPEAQSAQASQPGEGSSPLPAVAATGGEGDAHEECPETVHARSVWLSSERLAITGKVDLVEAQGDAATPVDYKRGKRPHTAGGAWQPERVQLCAQGLLLREHGFAAEGGFLYFIGSRERVPVAFTDELVAATQDAIVGARAMAAKGLIPPPLDEDFKCSRCSLIGICLPDEVRYLTHAHAEPRPIYPSLDRCLPLYVQSNRARIRKEGEVLIVEEEKAEVARARLGEVSHVVLHGPVYLSTPALHE
ncbi:MAG: CRISPR-associated protein Cas4, partial [Syntrophales bacterium]